MLVVLQFPIADLRSFADQPDTRLPVCLRFDELARLHAQDKKPLRPYIRHTGSARRRLGQGLHVAGEVLAFAAGRLLRWQDGLHAVPHPAGGAPVPMRMAFRRLQPYSDRAPQRVTRLEIGWQLDVAAGGRAAMTPAQLQALLDTCLALPVSVAQYDAPAPLHRLQDLPLLQAGPAAARQLRWATSLRPGSGGTLPDEWTLSCGKPALLVEFGAAELDGDPALTGRVDWPPAPDVPFWGVDRPVGGQALPCWFVRSHRPRVDGALAADGADAQRMQQLRNLRTAVLRQHAEREVLSLVLANVAIEGRLAVEGLRDGDTQRPAAAALRQYLMGALALITQRDGRSRQLPLTRPEQEVLEPAARLVDEVDAERQHGVLLGLAEALGAEAMLRVQQALQHLPMGGVGDALALARLAEAERPLPLEIMVSYAHADERDGSLLSRLRDTLHRDVLGGVTTVWTDHRIEPGTVWSEQIEGALRKADVIVLLLTPAFLASAYCMQHEVPLALALHRAGRAALLPVEVLPCREAVEKLELGSVQMVRPWDRAVLSNGNPPAAWAWVRHQIYRAAVQLRRQRQG